MGSSVYRYKPALRVGALSVAALALVFWARPMGKVVIGPSLALLVVLAIIESLGRPSGPARDSASPT